MKQYVLIDKKILFDNSLSLEAKGVYGLMMSFLSHTYLFLPYILFALVLVGYRIFSISEAQGVKYRPRQRRRRMAF